MLAQKTQKDVFHAISEPNRRKILEILKRGECPVKDLVKQFDVSFAAVSQHLKVLREAHLVIRRSEGRKRIYRLNPAPLKEVHDWTALYEQAWLDRFRHLRAYLEGDP